MFVQIIVTLHVDLDSYTAYLCFSFNLTKSRQADADRDEGSVLVGFFPCLQGTEVRNISNQSSLRQWPRHSMYGIFTYILEAKFMVHVGR